MPFALQKDSVVNINTRKRVCNRCPARVPYSIPNSRSSSSSGPKIDCVVGTVVRKRGGQPRTARTPENIVRHSLLRSPTRFARKHTTALRLPNRTMRRILHQDLNLHPYKMIIVQELSERDWHSRIVAYYEMIENLLHDVIVYFSDGAHFHVPGRVNK